MDTHRRPLAEPEFSKRQGRRDTQKAAEGQEPKSIHVGQKSRLLHREGYDVVTAKDGVDALQWLKNTQPDIMLLDIEMPRMDGFELTKVLRADSRTAHLPIIMITSRTADKHREHAMSLGVNAYLGKPYQEDTLLDTIAELTGQFSEA